MRADAAFRLWPQAYGLFPEPENRRLAISALAALTLHLLLLGLIRAPLERPPGAKPPLILQWRPLPAVRGSDQTDSAILAGLPAKGPAVQRDRGDRSAPITSDAREAVPAKYDATDDSTHPPPGAAELVNSARLLVNRMTHEQALARRENAMPEERPFLPQLDRALRKNATAETHLADGTIRITTASDTRYCLKPTPDAARGGLVEPLAVPATCP